MKTTNLIKESSEQELEENQTVRITRDGQVLKTDVDQLISESSSEEDTHNNLPVNSAAVENQQTQYKPDLKPQPVIAPDQVQEVPAQKAVRSGGGCFGRLIKNTIWSFYNCFGCLLLIISLIIVGFIIYINI